MSADRRIRRWLGASTVVTGGALAAAAAFRRRAQLSQAAVPAQRSSGAGVQELPEATSAAMLPDAPRDRDRRRGTGGTIVHPRVPLPVLDRPAGTAFALVRPTHPGGETRLPVVDRREGWVRVLLPTRPTGACGWLDAARVVTEQTPFDVRVFVGARKLRLLRDGAPVGEWPINVGARRMPARPSRTFVFGMVRRAPAGPPVLLRLALHADDNDPGLITIHRRTTSGSAHCSHGCISVPDLAMTALHDVSPGCLVRIDPR